MKTARTIRGSTESVARRFVGFTEAGRRWRERYLKRLREGKRRERAIARKAGAWGMKNQQRGYQERRAVTAVLLGPKGKKRGAVVYAERAGGTRDEVRKHDVPLRSFVSDLKRKVKIKRAMSKSEALKLRKRVRAATAAITRAKARSAVTAFDAPNAIEREAATRFGDARLLKVARESARLVEAAASRSGLSPALRRRVEALRAEVAEILKALGRPMERGRVTGDAESDGGSGEISRLLHEPETSTRGAGKDDGMGGDPLYERCDECGEVECECSSEVEEAQDWDDTGMDGDAAEEPDVDEGLDAIDEETGERRGGPPFTKEEVNYRYASDPRRSCGRCRFFQEPAGCRIVSGMIIKTDVCDRFEARGAR